MIRPQKESAAPKASYEIDFLPAEGSLRPVHVRACFENLSSPWLFPVDREGARSAEPLSGINIDGTRWEVFAPDGCVEYRVVVTAPTLDSALGKLNTLLWAPARRNQITPRLTVHNSGAGWLSMPWGEGATVETSSVLRFAGNFAIIPEPPIRFEEGGIGIEIARLPQPLGVGDSALLEWIGGSARLVASYGGTFPNHVQVVVSPAEGALDQPVPFGLARRGGGASVLLFVNSSADLEALESDWVLVHELSHLLIPYTTSPRWISEGFATYMQEIVRMQDRRLSREVVWERLM